LKQIAFESVERRVIEWLEAFNRHDANTLSQLYDERAELVDPWYPKPLKGLVVWHNAGK